MTRPGKFRLLRLAALLVGCAGMLAVGVPQAAAGTTCPLTHGFWRNHTSAWLLTSLSLGTTTYTAAQAETILDHPAGGDASLILANQLIAALLNIAAGAPEPVLVASTIADADAALGSGPIPENILPSTVLGQRMVNDAVVLNNYNNGTLPGSCGAPSGSCQPSGSLSVLVQGSSVTSYVPKGAWIPNEQVTDVSVVNVEGSSITPTRISTPNVVNSCASNSVTGVTVCTANNTDVYLLNGTTLNSALTSAGTFTIFFSGGSCTNCAVAMDAVHNKAVIGLGIAGEGAFQFLDLATSTLEPAFLSMSSPVIVPGPPVAISEGPLIDPIRNYILSASENGTYEIVNVTNSTSPAFFENFTGVNFFSGGLDSSGEDCTTGIALASNESTSPFPTSSNVYIADLTQAVFTPGFPAGTWTAPSQLQNLSEAALNFGASGIAVAQGTHTGVVSGEFGGNAITAIALPATSGSGTPAISDWVTCSIPGFSAGFDPHTVTAYQSPNSGDAIALLANANASLLAMVDLTKMLNSTIVPRTVGGHGCAAGTLPSAVVSFISVP